MIRRTSDISTQAQRPRGHSVPSRVNTPAERDAARRLVERLAADPADGAELLAALGLNEEVTDA